MRPVIIPSNAPITMQRTTGGNDMAPISCGIPEVVNTVKIVARVRSCIQIAIGGAGIGIVVVPDRSHASTGIMIRGRTVEIGHRAG